MPYQVVLDDVGHYTHEPYKQTLHHPLPNVYPLGQSGDGQPDLKPKKTNVRINVLDEIMMKVLHKKIKDK